MSFHLSDNQDPWGRPGQKRSEQQGQGSAQEPKQKNDQQPPDLEEAFSSLLKKMGGGNNNGNNPSSFTFGKFLPAILGIAAVVWGVSGFIPCKKRSVVWFHVLVNYMKLLCRV